MTRDITRTEKKNRISRRSAVTGALAVTAAAKIGSTSAASAKASELVIPNFGGALDEAFKAAYFDTFTAKTGIPIKSVSRQNGASRAH
jgi:putative spermidine/putrescine transport system substrate-binding protein